MTALRSTLVLLSALACSPLAHAGDPGDRDAGAPEVTNLHGFRLGYAYVNTPADALQLADAMGVTVNPNYSLVGYELSQRLDGGSWLNLLIVENVMLAGMNQSLVRPQANVLIGFDIENIAEFGLGGNWSPFDPLERPVHLIGAIGMTPQVGKLNVPVHLTWMPDVAGYWRAGFTVGVNWGEG
jgi:hypothetical protein